MKKTLGQICIFLIFRKDANSEEESFTLSLTSSEGEIIHKECCPSVLQAEQSWNLPPCETEDSGNGSSFAREASPNEDCMHFLKQRWPGHLPKQRHIKKADNLLDNGYFKRRGLKIKRHPARKFYGGNYTKHYSCHTPAYSGFEITFTFTFAIKPAFTRGHSTANERVLATEMANWRKRPPGCDENSSDRISRLNPESLFCH